MNTFLHRTVAAAKAGEDNGDLITTILTDELHQTLLLAKEEIGDIALTCQDEIGDFKKGKDYAVCHIAMRGMCIVDKDQNHAPLPREVVQKHFVLRTTRSRLEGIRGLAADALAQRTERLKALAASFTKKQPNFMVGDEVKWKPGLRNKIRPMIGETGVVVEVRETPDRCTDNVDSDEAAAKLDVVVAVLDEDGDFMHYPIDSRRLERAN